MRREHRLRHLAIPLALTFSVWFGLYFATYDVQGRCLEGDDVMGCQGWPGLAILGAWLLLGCVVFVLLLLTVVFAVIRRRTPPPPRDREP